MDHSKHTKQISVNGLIHAFPSSMSDDDILGVLRKKYPQTKKDQQQQPSDNKGNFFKFVEEILPRTLEAEGGISKDKTDKPTNQGITPVALAEWKNFTQKEGTLFTEKDINKEEIYNLPPELTPNIYFHLYYSKPKIDKLPKEVQPIVFDHGVTASPLEAIKVLQKIVGADTDGVLGEETLDRVKNYIQKNGKEELIRRYAKGREDFYKGLTNKKRYLKGWLNRVKSFYEDFGDRQDGTKKGPGFLGKLNMKDGSKNIATEKSIDIDVDGARIHIPSIVPTLDKNELDYILEGKLNSGTDQDKEKDIQTKAVDHAMKRRKEGLSPFKGWDE